MASPAAGIPDSIRRPHRKPLKPINFLARLGAGAAANNPKKPIPCPILPPPPTAEGPSRKENGDVTGREWEVEIMPGEAASLGEELEAVRQRTERLRHERKRAEAKMREMDDVFERWMREAERRLEEIAAVDMEIRRLVRAKDRRSSFGKFQRLPPPFLSLRAREEEKRRKAAQLQVNGNAEGKKIESSGSNGKE